ncbi:hypothetical protein ACUOFC_22035, partial [Escherichia sp. TWPC-MK]
MHLSRFSTCSVTCKNVWTSREGVEYAWFNNVETKPGQGFPTDWENQEKYKGGWIRKINGKLQPRMGNRAMLLGKIFANPHLPGIDDYYEPFDFDYQNLHTAPEGSKSQPIARPRSLITGERMAKIEKGPNWEDDQVARVVFTVFWLFCRKTDGTLFQGFHRIVHRIHPGFFRFASDSQ